MFKLKHYKSISQREDKTTTWWKKHKTFEKSVEERPKNNQYSFLDGPPFVTGMPHYGHLTGRIAKDVIPRYQTMKGKRVRRVWGWDCHGLPIEEKVEKKIGLKNRRDIEKYGINKFLEECNRYVEEVSSEWEWYVDKIGEWIDFKNAYKTMNTDFMESVIWTFKELYDKGLVYKGVKTLLYCTRCGTPVSKFEIAMDDSYMDMEDPAVTVEFSISSKGKFQGAKILAWTTTPWTLPSNRALVLDPKETYIEFKLKERSDKRSAKGYIVAKKRLKSVVGKNNYEVMREFKGQELLGLSYKPPFDYFPPNNKDLKVYEYPEMVTMDEGTGIVHSAPGFGEVDTLMGQDTGLTIMFSVDDEGKFKEKVIDYKGMYVKDADKEIIKDLKKEGLLFKLEKITHRYPYCYRCETPLIHRAQQGWFIKIQGSKKKLHEMNKSINWVPKKMTKRFENTIKTAPDWNISRTRYWATVMPIWECEECNELEVLGSIKEIESRSGQKVKNLHRDGVDHITFSCKKCNESMKRIPEVLDVWFESGSMPYGQIHYPFENKELFKQTFPGDYLFGNYTDPKETLEKYGGDALRLYLMGSNIMLANDPNFDEEEIKNQVTTVVFPFWNSFKYFTTYANLHNWKPARNATHSVAGGPSTNNTSPSSTNQLDRWILARLKAFHEEVETNLDNYYMPPATRAIAPFLADLSTWYIRRSRDRFVAGDKDALATLYNVLVETAKITAPIMPFVSEELYQRLVVDFNKKEPESVHLCNWPEKKEMTNEERELLRRMKTLREIVSLGQSIRVESGIKLRQPVNTVSGIRDFADGWEAEILKDELNVKNLKAGIKQGKGWVPKGNNRWKISIDTKLTSELKKEGLVRELVREIQNMRKKLGFKQEDTVEVIIETDHNELLNVIHEYQEDIKKQTNSTGIKPGKGEKATKVNGNEIKMTIKK